MILAGQRRSQCVVADLAFHVIGDKVIYEIIDIFLKPCVIICLVSRQYFGDLSGPFGIHLQTHMITTGYMLL